MADFRIVISDKKSGLAHQIEVTGGQANKFIGKKVGDTITGDAVNLPGYSLKITGGTDKAGFPIRTGLPGAAKRKVLVAGGVGFKPPSEGVRRRKTFRGMEISSDIGQINTVVQDYGPKPIDVLLGGGQEEAAPEKKAE